MYKDRKVRRKRPEWRSFCQFNRKIDQEMNQAIHEQHWPEARRLALLLASTIRIIPDGPDFATDHWIARTFQATLRARFRDTWGTKNGLRYAFSTGPRGSYHLIETKIRENHLGTYNIFKLTVLDKIPTSSYFKELIGTRNAVTMELN